MLFKMTHLNVSLPSKSEVSYPQYHNAVFPNMDQFLATGVYVDNDGKIFLHVLAEGEIPVIKHL